MKTQFDLVMADALKFKTKFTKVTAQTLLLQRQVASDPKWKWADNAENKGELSRLSSELTQCMTASPRRRRRRQTYDNDNEHDQDDDDDDDADDVADDDDGGVDNVWRRSKASSARTPRSSREPSGMTSCSWS